MRKMQKAKGQWSTPTLGFFSPPLPLLLPLRMRGHTPGASEWIKSSVRRKKSITKMINSLYLFIIRASNINETSNKKNEKKSADIRKKQNSFCNSKKGGRGAREKSKAFL